VTFREKVHRVWEMTSAIEASEPVTAPRLYRAALWTVRRVSKGLLVASQPTAHLVCLRVDRLVAMGRRDEAVALLERSLRVDTSELLRRKLVELRSHLKVV
jgi:hypothetical protein